MYPSSGLLFETNHGASKGLPTCLCGRVYVASPVQELSLNPAIVANSNNTAWRLRRYRVTDEDLSRSRVRLFHVFARESVIISFAEEVQAKDMR